MKRYLIDTFAEEMVEATVAAVVSARRQIKKPLQNLAMWRDSSESFIPLEILLYWKPGKPAGYSGADLVLTPEHPKTNVPFSLFVVEERGDKVQAEFLKKYKLKKSPWWDQAIATPRVLVTIERHRAFSSLAERLGQKDIPLAPRFKAYDASPDGMEEIRDKSGLEAAIQRDLKAKLKTQEQITAFSELCYESLERQQWLQALAR